jgi:hypothetical protein
MNFDEYKAKTMAKPTDYLIQRYPQMNAEYRGYVRTELRKRHRIRDLNVHLRLLNRKPVKASRRTQSRNVFGIRPISIGRMF